MIVDVRIQITDNDGEISLCRRTASVINGRNFLDEFASLLWDAVEGTGYATPLVMAKALDNALDQDDALPPDECDLHRAVRAFIAKIEGP